LKAHNVFKCIKKQNLSRAYIYKKKQKYKNAFMVKPKIAEEIGDKKKKKEQ
jgi:hypothetical protein